MPVATAPPVAPDCMLITISRQYGAGGSEVARRVAEALGGGVVDNELVEQVAARAGLPAEKVAAREERSHLRRAAGPDAGRRHSRSVPTSDSVHTMVDLPEAELVRITETVVREAAARGRVVVVGRAAPAVLERQADTLHVKLVAPRAWRIEVAAARLGVPLAQAAAVLDDTDKMRARYTREYYRRDWNDPVHFHMVLNTAALGLDGATEAVVGRARMLGWG